MKMSGSKRKEVLLKVRQEFLVALESKINHLILFGMDQAKGQELITKAGEVFNQPNQRLEGVMKDKFDTYFMGPDLHQFLSENFLEEFSKFIVKEQQEMTDFDLRQEKEAFQVRLKQKKEALQMQKTEESRSLAGQLKLKNHFEFSKFEKLKVKISAGINRILSGEVTSESDIQKLKNAIEANIAEYKKLYVNSAESWSELKNFTDLFFVSSEQAFFDTLGLDSPEFLLSKVNIAVAEHSSMLSGDVVSPATTPATASAGPSLVEDFGGLSPIEVISSPASEAPAAPVVSAAQAAPAAPADTVAQEFQGAGAPAGAANGSTAEQLLDTPESKLRQACVAAFVNRGFVNPSEEQAKTQNLARALYEFNKAGGSPDHQLVPLAHELLASRYKALADQESQAAQEAQAAQAAQEDQAAQVRLTWIQYFDRAGNKNDKRQVKLDLLMAIADGSFPINGDKNAGNLQAAREILSERLEYESFGGFVMTTNSEKCLNALIKAAELNKTDYEGMLKMVGVAAKHFTEVAQPLGGEKSAETSANAFRNSCLNRLNPAPKIKSYGASSTPLQDAFNESIDGTWGNHTPHQGTPYSARGPR